MPATCNGFCGWDLDVNGRIILKKNLLTALSGMRVSTWPSSDISRRVVLAKQSHVSGVLIASIFMVMSELRVLRILTHFLERGLMTHDRGSMLTWNVRKLHSPTSQKTVIIMTLFLIFLLTAIFTAEGQQMPRNAAGYVLFHWHC